MSNYKGEIKSLTDITAGTPIEIVDPSVFNYPSDKPYVGILKQLHTDPYKATLKYPTVDIWDGEKFNNIQLYSKNYSRTNYSGHGVLPECNAVKVLTGTKGLQLLKLWGTNIDYNTIYTEQLYVTLGTDPEIFVENNKGVIPAWEFLPDSKNPLKAVDKYGSRPCSAYWDGVQAEFTTFASGCCSWVIDSTQCALDLILKTALAYDKEARLSMKSVIDLPDEVLINAADPQLAFGCNPSFNAYGKTGEKVESPRLLPFRFAGGHIHMGHTLKGEAVTKNTVKALDAILGVLAVGMFAKLDDPRRRRFYGLAGEYRTPPHGLEYRVLSNAMFCHPAIAFLLFDISRYAAYFGNKSTFSLLKYDEDQVQHIINNCDVDEARKVITTRKELYNKLACNMYTNSASASKLIMRMALEGVECALDPHDVKTNWRLGVPNTNRYDVSNTKQWVPHGDGIGEHFNSFCTLVK